MNLTRYSLVLVACAGCVTIIWIVLGLSLGSKRDATGLDTGSAPAAPGERGSVAEAHTTDPAVLAGQFSEDEEDPGLVALTSVAQELNVGQLAPTFDLSTLDGTSTFSLLEFRQKKPVVLFFGSYT